YVTSATYSSIDENRFWGTSAATPHVGGAAALYKQAFPNATSDATLGYLTSHAKPPKGDDVGKNISGAGLLFLDAVPQGASTAPVQTTAATPTRVPGTVVATASRTRSPATATRVATGTATTPTAARSTSAATATATDTALRVVFSDGYSSPASGLPKAGYQKG